VIHVYNGYHQQGDVATGFGASITSMQDLNALVRERSQAPGLQLEGDAIGDEKWIVVGWKMGVELKRAPSKGRFRDKVGGGYEGRVCLGVPLGGN